MSKIGYARFKALEKLEGERFDQQLETMIQQVHMATPVEISTMKVHLAGYQGPHKQVLKRIITEGKLEFPASHYRLHKKRNNFETVSKSFTQISNIFKNKNFDSFWRCLRFWGAQLQNKKSSETQKKQLEVSQKVQQMLFQEEQQTLLFRNKRSANVRDLGEMYESSEKVLKNSRKLKKK